MKKKVEILGVRIDNFSVADIKENISAILDGESSQKFVTTLNPEILLKAHQDENYKKILNSSDLNICDGFGLKLLSILKNTTLEARFAGVDLVDFVLNEVSKNTQKVLIVAGQHSLSSPFEIEQVIRKKYPNISVKSEYFSTSQKWFENDIIKQCEIVFVNFGAPSQEEFIFENKAKFPNAKILVGVGGTFDFLTGKIRRASLFLRKMGLEWIWRLIQEPKRFRRIWNAVVVFPAVAIFNKK